MQQPIEIKSKSAVFFCLTKKGLWIKIKYDGKIEYAYNNKHFNYKKYKGVKHVEKSSGSNI